MTTKTKTFIRNEKMTDTKNTKIVSSDVKIGKIVTLPTKSVKPIPVIIRRLISENSIADEIRSRITGKLVNFPDLFDPKTGQFLTESELKAKGAVYITVYYKCLQDKTKMVVKNRETKELNPWLGSVYRKQSYQMIVNIDWESYVNRRGTDTHFKANKERSNGVKNYGDCRAVGETTKGRKTLNGVIFRIIERAYYENLSGEKLNFNGCEIYRKKPSLESKEIEAEKHGLTVKTDVHYSTTRISNCESVRAFGFEYIPTD